MITLPPRHAAITWTDIVNAQPVKNLRGMQMEIAHRTGYVPECFRIIDSTLKSIFAVDEFDRYHKDLIFRMNFVGDKNDALMYMMWGPDSTVILDEETAPYGEIIVEAVQTSYFEGAQAKFIGCF